MKKITTEQAIHLLPTGDTVHTFANPAVGIMLGADHSR